jgi:hypothetical protein
MGSAKGPRAKGVSMSRFLASLVLGVCLLSPVGALNAQEHHDQQHQWNDGENDSWHKYLKERHKKDHEWSKSNKREQAAYWKWRDQHR